MGGSSLSVTKRGDCVGVRVGHSRSQIHMEVNDVADAIKTQLRAPTNQSRVSRGIWTNERAPLWVVWRERTAGREGKCQGCRGRDCTLDCRVRVELSSHCSSVQHAALTIITSIISVTMNNSRVQLAQKRRRLVRQDATEEDNEEGGLSLSEF